MKLEKIKKIVFALVVAISTISLSNTPVSANDTEVVNQYLALKSEYNMLKSEIAITRSAKSSKELIETESKIANFKNHIYELKNMSVEDLRRLNFNNEQIQAITTYDGSEEKTVRASPTIKFTVAKNTFSYSSSTGLTTLKATVNFSWQGSPSEYGSDAFGMAYEADNNHKFKKVEIASSSLKYKEYQSPSYVKTWTKSATKKGDQGVTGSYGFSFPFKVMGDKYYAFLVSGSFTTTGVVSGKLKYFNVRYLYSHRDLILSSGFGITISSSGVSGGINLSSDFGYTGYPSRTGGIETFE